MSYINLLLGRKEPMAPIPTNGVYITENSNPKGFYVAKYDTYGFTSAPRWFPTLREAEAYARRLNTIRS